MNVEVFLRIVVRVTKPIYVIAEIGINHNGDIRVARALMDMAKSCGCDAVKFQKRTIEVVYPGEVLNQPRESPWGSTQRHQKMGLEFGLEEYKLIERYAKELGLDWSASAWDVESQIFLRQFNTSFNKVASALVTHYELLRVIAQEGKLTYLSTGMSTIEEIDEAMQIFVKEDCPVVLMHCVSTYPARDEDLNLSLIPFLAQRYGVPIGYSGHESSVSPSIVAAALGAVAIERHITLNRAMYGSDQAASLEERGLRELVGALRKVPTILGTPNKRILQSELSIRDKLRYW